MKANKYTQNANKKFREKNKQQMKTKLTLFDITATGYIFWMSKNMQKKRDKIT